MPWPLPKAETLSISCYSYFFVALTHGQGLLAGERASLVDLILGLLVNFVPWKRGVGVGEQSLQKRGALGFIIDIIIRASFVGLTENYGLLLR